MKIQRVGAFAVGLLMLCGCADNPIEASNAVPQPIGPAFTFDRYPYPSYYQFVHALNHDGKLELCGASIMVNDGRLHPTPDAGEADVGGVKVQLGFIRRYAVDSSTDLGQALQKVTAGEAMPESVRAKIAALSANCVVTPAAWRDDLQAPKLTADDWMERKHGGPAIVTYLSGAL